MQTELLVSPNYAPWPRVEQPRNKEPNIPYDPRSWSRGDVGAWLEWTVRAHRLPWVPGERFPMNGKAVCLMSLPMFLDRAPLGGKTLYKDFQLRLARAMHREAVEGLV